MPLYRELTDKQLAVLLYGARRTVEQGVRYASGGPALGRYETWRLATGEMDPPDVSQQVYALLRRRLIRIDRDQGIAVPLLAPTHLRNFVPPGRWSAYRRSE